MSVLREARQKDGQKLNEVDGEEELFNATHSHTHIEEEAHTHTRTALHCITEESGAANHRRRRTKKVINCIDWNIENTKK